MDDFREFLAGLPGKMSQKNLDAIVEHVEALMPPETVNTVEVLDARIPTHHVRAHGLDIMLDASGNAVAVIFPHGGMVTE